MNLTRSSDRQSAGGRIEKRRPESSAASLFLLLSQRQASGSEGVLPLLGRVGFASFLRPTCRMSDCWCKAWPIIRLIHSTGVRYTVEALPHVGEPWLFRYRYGAAA